MASISTCLTLSPKSRLLTAKPSFSLNFFPGVQTLTSSSTFPRKSGNLFRPRVSFPAIKASTGVGSIAIRHGGAVETDKLPSDVRKRVMEAVDAFGGRVTIGDVSKAGLNLNLSQKALQALASDTNGFLEAYAVELEAELNQLKQENAHLKQALIELERKRKQQCVEEWKIKTQPKKQKAKEKLRIMRRNQSCPL